jgi:hypothetical protein
MNAGSASSIAWLLLTFTLPTDVTGKIQHPLGEERHFALVE